MDRIVVEIPAAFKAASECCRELFERVEKARAQAALGEPLAYATVEREIARDVNAVECALHAAVLQALARDEPRLRIDGVLHRRALFTRTTFYSLAGPVTVERWLYRLLEDRDARVVDPVALQVGAFAGTWLSATATAMAFLVQQGPVREAAQTAHQLGVVPYSAASFHRVTQAVGADYAANQDAIEEILIERYDVPAAATGITLSLDRVAGPFEVPRRPTHARSTKKAPRRPVARVWKMIYCASLTLHDKDGRALDTLRYGCMPDASPETVASAMLVDVEVLRAQRPDLFVEVICDGAREMWSLLDNAVAAAGLEDRVRRLVDLWHLLGYVGKALRVRYDAGRAAAELARWKMRLLNQSGAAHTLLEELRGWDATVRARWVGEEQPVADAMTYLANQIAAHRVDYAAARRRGQPVGSGSVEATCKSLVGVRFKRAGSRWKQDSASHVLRLRAVALSRRWDAAMELLHSNARPEIRSAA